MTRLTEQHAEDLVELGKQSLKYSQLGRRYDTLETGVKALVDMLAPQDVGQPIVDRLPGALDAIEELFKGSI